jgi:hypothetical protein
MTARWLCVALAAACHPSASDPGTPSNGEPPPVDAVPEPTSTVTSPTTPEPGEPPCGPDAAPCTAPGCDPELCLTPSHVAGLGLWALSGDLDDVALTGNHGLDTDTGAISGARSPNRDPSEYEVLSGIGFVVQDQGDGSLLAIWSFLSLATSAWAASPLRPS